MTYDKVLVNTKPQLSLEQIHHIRNILCDHLEIISDVLHENDEDSDEYREITDEINQVDIIIDALTIGWARCKHTTGSMESYKVGKLVRSYPTYKNNGHLTTSKTIRMRRYRQWQNI